jgi:hypothetical protein
MRRILGLTAMVVAAAVLAMPAAHAWGDTGHKAVALIAAPRLEPSAAAAVSDLLDNPDTAAAMAGVASWADEIRRGRGETAHWHYVDIEIDSAGYDAARDCANDDCVVAQITKDVAILKDKSLAKPVRAEALKFLIHFVGDIHQPLHCADNHDKGGNKVVIMAGPKKTNLHAIWDTAVVNAISTDPAAIASALSAKITPAFAAQWSTGTPEQWAGEGYLIAKTQIYPQFPGSGGTLAPIVLPDSYPASMGPVTAMQLAKAGIRLAAVLNEALATPVLVAPAPAANP